MAVTIFFDLFDFLDEKLGVEQCDDTLKLTQQYLTKIQEPRQTVTDWLNKNGAYCDCEVLYNVEEKFENLKS